jgi:alpha-glucuronidase
MFVPRKPALLLLRPASVKNSDTAIDIGYDSSKLVYGIFRLLQLIQSALGRGKK